MAHSRDEARAAIEAREQRQDIRARVVAETNTPEYQAAEAARQQLAAEERVKQHQRDKYDLYVGDVNAYNEDLPKGHATMEPVSFEHWLADGGEAEAAATLPAEDDAEAPETPAEPSAGPGKARSRPTLAEAVQDVVLDEPDEASDPRFQGGAVLIRWALFPDPENPQDPEAYTLGMSVEKEGQVEPDQVFLDITARQQHSWRKLQGEKVLERFAAGLIEKLIETTSYDLGEELISALHRITDGDLRKGKVRAVPDMADQEDADNGAE